MTTEWLARTLVGASLLAWVGMMLNLAALANWIPLWPAPVCMFTAVIVALVSIIWWAFGLEGRS